MCLMCMDLLVKIKKLLLLQVYIHQMCLLFLGGTVSVELFAHAGSEHFSLHLTADTNPAV